MDKKKRGFNPETSALNLTNRPSPECHLATGERKKENEKKNKIEETSSSKSLL